MPRSPKSILVPASLRRHAVLGLAGGYARAAEPAPRTPPAGWWDTFTIGGTVEAGVTLNGDNPADGLNFGHLFTDKANTPLLNQILLTRSGPLDPRGDQLRFRLQVARMYGSDARFIHYLGEADYAPNELNQVTPVEAWAAAHLPWLFSGGIDIKAGQFVTLEGAETIDPTTNYLYSHTYIFNFGIPFVHTGVMTVSHVDPLVDIYAGVTSGVNTTFEDVSTRCPSRICGRHRAKSSGWQPLHDSRHHPYRAINSRYQRDQQHYRFHHGVRRIAIRTPHCAFSTTSRPPGSINDLLDPALPMPTTFTTMVHTLMQWFWNLPSGAAMASRNMSIYTVNDWLKAVGRVEVWRDNDNFFVAAYPGNYDFVNLEHGFINSSIAGGPAGGNHLFREITGSPQHRA